MTVNELYKEFKSLNIISVQNNQQELWNCVMKPSQTLLGYVNEINKLFIRQKKTQTERRWQQLLEDYQ